MHFWQTPRIRLRGVEPADASLFFQWNRDSERARNLDFIWPPVSLEATRRWATETSVKRLEHGAYHWIIENVQEEAVGSISTHNCEPRNGVFSLAFDIAAPHRRQGYATEAVELVMRYYFDELRYQKAFCVVYSFNTASIAFHTRFGYVHEGTLRRMVYHNGKHHDKLMFGMTDDEFRARSGLA